MSDNAFFKKVSIFVTASLFLFASCSTTKSLQPIDSKSEQKYIISEELNFDDVEKPYKYIFFRLYDPDYSNPFYIANLLKFGINTTEVTDLPPMSHASINFSLDDNFYGLTQASNNKLFQESCNNLETNEYMKKSNPKTSIQYTYALKVPEKEYEQTKIFVENYINNYKINFQTSQLFGITMFSINRKFFTSKQKQQFGTVDYPKEGSKEEKKITENDDFKPEENFTCSTFIGYTLQNNVESIRFWFNKNNVNYKYIIVSDIVFFPGMQLLFYSTWDQYCSAAKAFVDKYPEFAKYLNN